MAGVRVVELGVWVAGPAAGGILADWGADVVKVEPPGLGDPARLFQAMFGADVPFNPPFEMDNRSKKMVVVDLTTGEGRAVMHELLATADVFVTNVRVAALGRVGLDPDELVARHPRLVVGVITGYGLAGEEADRAAYDIAAFWSRAGVAGALTRPGSPPPFQRGGMGDHNTGMVLAGAVSAALFNRERTGRGQVVSTSLLREGMYTMSFDLAANMRLGVPIAPADRTAMVNPCINCYQDAEGRWFWIVGLEGDRHWPHLCRAVEREEWLNDERYGTAMRRAMHARELIAELDAIFATRTREEWGLAFDAQPELWWAPVQSPADLLADPQAWAAGGFVEVPDADGMTTLLPATPADFHGTPTVYRWMAGSPGAHTDEVLRELGHDDASIARLRGVGAVA
jgi:crotonobetainyl-CoA:carnitine CoA-transferase CaiB-like acyl-CoA transferase